VETFELEVLPGLEPFAIREIEQRFRSAKSIRQQSRAGRIEITARGVPLRRLNDLRSVVAAYAVQQFLVPRPRALLGQQHLDRLLDLCRRIIAAHPRGTFGTLHISAAGADSAVFGRLRQALAASLGLEISERAADLLLAIRRPLTSAPGWEVLVRTSPRPLSARAWRVCDLPGALNATAAHAMVTLADPRPDEVFVNIGCGSGTLMIERLTLGPAGSVTGYDIDVRALQCAQANMQASGYAQAVQLTLGDARRLPLATGSVNTLVADLPFAMLLGAANTNAELYPALIDEAARVAAPAAKLIVVTTQNQLMRAVLDRQREQWESTSTVSFKVPHQRGYINPYIYVLVRRPAT
jgi:tRNA (guanine6-N2)-methyltransferase